MTKKWPKLTTPKNTNTKSYTMNEFVENMMGFCNVDTKTECRQICEGLNELLTQCLKKGYKVPLLGLGKLYVRKSKARNGRNPATGEAIKIPAKKKVKFSVAKALKEAVL